MSNAANLKTLLTSLVAMPTVTKDAIACRTALDWCKDQIAHLPLHVTEFTRDGHSSLILTTRATKHPKVFLLAHIDVAEAGSEMFNLREQDGNYYGRGVFDMKFAIAAYLKLLLDLGDKLPGYDLGVMLTSDEEGDGTAGVNALMKAGWRADVVINPDAIPGWQIECAVKGILRYRVQSSGDTGHGSRPWLYRNALTQLMDYLQDLRLQFPVEPCGDPDHAHSTLSIYILNAGVMIGQIPQQAVAEFEIRLSPKDELDAVKFMVETTARRHVEISLAITLEKPSSIINPNHPYMLLLERLIAEVTGRRPPFTISHGQSDSAYFRAVDVPALTFGTTAGGHHSREEWIDVRGIAQFYEVIRRFVDETAKLNEAGSRPRLKTSDKTTRPA
jgi:succinyl-diaminopimelate desuccinylase